MAAFEKATKEPAVPFPTLFHAPTLHSGHLPTAMRQDYLPRLARVICELNPKRYLVIGAYLGLVESLALRWGWKPETIVVVDADIEDYSPRRENGSAVFMNICSRQFGSFDGKYVQIRADSKEFGLSDLGVFGPFDLAFVDGEHSDEAAFKDTQTCCEMAGIVMVHDLALSDVARGFHRFVEQTGKSHILIPNSMFFNGMGVVFP